MRTSSLAQPRIMVAIAHAAPTAPAPIIPIFMMSPRLSSGFQEVLSRYTMSKVRHHV
jgi:hypothetical protein